MGRTPCCDKDTVKRGPWSPEEDATLKSYVQTHGTGGNWIALPKKAGLRRCGKSCRLRWLNYLRPDIKHGGFSEEEDNIICRLYFEIGSRWSVIASNLPGRTDNDVKNYWNTKLKKKLLSGKMINLAPPTTDNFIDLDPSLTQDYSHNMPKKIIKQDHEFSTSNCRILPANYAKFQASSALNDQEIPMEDPVYHYRYVEVGGGVKIISSCDHQYGSLLDISSDSLSSSINSNTPSNSSHLSGNNYPHSDMPLSYGYGEDNNSGGNTMDLGFGSEFPVDAANSNGGWNYPSFAELIYSDMKPQEIGQTTTKPIN